MRFLASLRMPRTPPAQGAPLLLAGTLGLLLETLGAAGAGEGTGGNARRTELRPEGVLVHYLSAVDGSRQEYGLYLPRSQPPSFSGYPMVMFTHGYGWAVSAGFGEWERDWADAHGWILVQCNGRGPNFYDGIGEDDVMRIIEDVAQRVPLDRERIYMTGGSMGGTGAFRMGVRRPDVFAAVAPVDGWTDYREFQWHWYARTDMRDDIEEFRRPYLEAISAVFVPQTALWGNILNITDAQDDVVYPWNGLGLEAALSALRNAFPGGYESELIYHLDRGHGGGWDVERIFEYFAACRRQAIPWAAAAQSTLLRYGRVHWVEIEAFHIQGALGSLYAILQDGAVYATAANVTRFALHLPDSPARTLLHVRVFVDGQQCYEGPPAIVHGEAVLDADDRIVGWRQALAPLHPASGRPFPRGEGRGEGPPLHKRAGLEGPVGEAFLYPFLVVYGTRGDRAAVEQNRTEAEDFAREWNEFNVHYEAVQAVPEEALQPEDIERHGLVLFGTLESSLLLRLAEQTHALPVKVHSEGVTVVDPVNGDRQYAGRQFGAYFVYPNPLTDFRTHLVVCHGRFRTEPEGTVLRGLGYDLEKLQWGWGDYVVFNNDWSELPRVPNVNNKPPVTCYEAGYFVEAGCFDQSWQPQRSLEADRVRALRPERSRLIRVADARLQGWDRLSAYPTEWPPSAEDAPRPPPQAEVLVTDEAGAAIQEARVTILWNGSAPEAHSAVTNADGWARFAAPAGHQGWDRLSACPTGWFRVVNVCATGATYDWRLDTVSVAGLARGGATGLSARANPLETVIRRDGTGIVSFQVSNLSLRAVQATGEVFCAAGGAAPRRQVLGISARAQATFTFVWDARNVAPGRYEVEGVFRDRQHPQTRCSATAQVVVREAGGSLVRVVAAGARDLLYGEPYELWAEVENWGAVETVEVTLGGTVAEAHRYLPTQTVRLSPGQKGRATWQAGPESPPLPEGLYHFCAFLPDYPDTTARADFTVR